MKLKTRKSVSKRIIEKKNFFSRKNAYKGHLMRKKSTKQCRALSAPSKVSNCDFKAIKRMLN
jgi:large subunit ribosomal protein L35